MIPLKIGMRGRFKIESVHPNGRITLLQDWSPNTVLTSGMREMSQRDGWLSSCQVGIDETNDPTPSFTAMPGWIAGTSTQEDNTVGVEITGPYGYRRIRYRFPIGSVAQNTNVNRVGVGWGTSAGDNLTTLAKTTDINGTPTAITWKADEYLDVTYEFQYHAPTVDVTGTVVVNSVTYNYIVRAMEATSQTAWANGIGSKIQSSAVVNSDWLAYDGDIGATIEDTPTGLTADSDNANDFTTAPAGVTYVDIGMNVGPGTNDVDGWSLTTGKLLRSLRIKTTAGWFQIQFDSQASPGNGIPKTSGFTIQSGFRLSWAEKT